MEPNMGGVWGRVLILADASTSSAVANDEVLGVVLAASVIGIVFVWSLISQYRRAIADNRIRAVCEFEDQYKKCMSQAKAMLDRAQSECRDFSQLESQEFSRLMDTQDQLQLDLDRARKCLPSAAPDAPDTSHVTSRSVHRPTLAVEGLLYLQLFGMLRHRHRDDR